MLLNSSRNFYTVKKISDCLIRVCRNEKIGRRLGITEDWCRFKIGSQYKVRGKFVVQPQRLLRQVWTSTWGSANNLRDTWTCRIACRFACLLCLVNKETWVELHDEGHKNVWGYLAISLELAITQEGTLQRLGYFASKLKFSVKPKLFTNLQIKAPAIYFLQSHASCQQQKRTFWKNLIKEWKCWLY